MNKHTKAVHEPLFHIVKRSDISKQKAVFIRVIAILSGLLVSSLISYFLVGIGPISLFKTMINGAFGSPRRMWILFHKVAILLCIALAITPAFKMRFWNIGAEGQVLIAGLSTYACMHYLGEKVSLPVLWLLMTASAIVAACIWTLIPALCKAQWNTNETLFTLMMNYVAIQLVDFFKSYWLTPKSGNTQGGTTLPILTRYGLPTILNNWLLNIIVILIITIAMFVYFNYSKHGYEISVVGESENTARYIGINVKKVIVRTMLLSGLICGICGLILVGSVDHSISDATVGGQGFTAIMVSWLAKFNPLFMALTSFLIIFLQVGSNQVCNTFKTSNPRIDDSIADIITAVILFFIIGCEFFINYRIMFRKSAKEAKK